MPPGPRRRSPHFLLFSLLVWYLGHTVASASPALGGVCGNCSFTECGFSKGSCAAPQPDGRCPPSSLICACLSCTAAEQACAFGNGTCAAAEGVDGLSCPMGAHLCIGLEVFVTELDEENMIDVSTKLARRAQEVHPSTVSNANAIAHAVTVLRVLLTCFAALIGAAICVLVLLQASATFKKQRVTPHPAAEAPVVAKTELEATLSNKRRTSNASLCQESGLLEGLSDNLAVLALARARRSSMSGNMLAPQTPLHVNRIGLGGDRRSSKVAPMLESILDAHDKEPVGHDHDARGGKVSFASNGASATAARPSKLGVIGDLTVQSVSMLHLHDGDAMGATESSAPNQSLDLAGTLSSPSAQCAGSVPGNSVSARNSTRSTEALHGQVAAGRPDLSTDSILESIIPPPGIKPSKSNGQLNQLTSLRSFHGGPITPSSPFSIPLNPGKRRVAGTLAQSVSAHPENNHSLTLLQPLTVVSELDGDVKPMVTLMGSAR